MKHSRRHSSLIAAAAAAQVVELEPRKLLHSFSLSDGLLNLDLTDANEELNVTVEGDKIRAQLKENGVNHDDQSWLTKSVKTIHVNGHAGNDLLKLSADIKVPATIGGGDGNDTIYGGSGNDLIGATAGDDFIDGGKGADTMIGGGGYDIVSYETRTKSVSSYQTLDNNVGRDGESGEHDYIYGDVTEIRGGSGNDNLHAGNFGTTKAGNKLVGNGGNDTLSGGARNDTLWGGSGNDRMDGGKGDDTLVGNSGADRMVGGDGKDNLDGGSGKDTLYGGKGIDHIYGGADRDSFYVADGYKDYVTGGSGNDVIKDKKDSTDVLDSVA